jgi:Tfp pilus assembly protein PilF
VFTDDVAQLLVRRTGRHAQLADRLAFHTLPAGIQRRMDIVPHAYADTVFRAAMARDLERALASSPENGHVHHLLGFVALMEGHNDAALDHFRRALARQPFLPKVHELSGLVLLEMGRPREALHEFERERDLQNHPTGIDFRIGQAWSRIGDSARAVRAWRLELKRNPGHTEARDSLAARGAL